MKPRTLTNALCEILRHFRRRESVSWPSSIRFSIMVRLMDEAVNRLQKVGPKFASSHIWDAA